VAHHTADAAVRRGAANVDLSGLTMVIGGSGCPKALALKALERGIDIYAGYGMSEDGPVLAVAHLKSHHLTGSPTPKWKSVPGRGSLFPGRSAHRRSGDEGNGRAGKATGEIVARAPWLTKGTLITRSIGAAVPGGYLHTNDIETSVPTATYQITDRHQDVIKTARVGFLRWSLRTHLGSNGA